MKVLTRREVESQQHILYENFSKTVAIEADCMIHMTSSYIVPAAMEYKNKITIVPPPKDGPQAKLIADYNHHLDTLLTHVDELKAAQATAKSFHEDKLHEQSTYYRQDVMGIMAKVRSASDALELMVDDKLWPFPKYSEILFLK